MILPETFYVTHGQIEEIAIQNYKHFGTETAFVDALIYLYNCGKYSKTPPNLYQGKDWAYLSDKKFAALLKKTPIFNPFKSIPPSGEIIPADGIFPENHDIFAIVNLQHIIKHKHIHNYFEISYVLTGSATMLFENETLLLNEGAFCIIAPKSLHDVYIDDDSIVLSLMIRENNFESSFFNLLSHKDLLSVFFRNILYSNNKTANYLLFATDNSDSLKRILKNLYMEVYLPDEYSSSCVTNRTHLLFATLLRKYSQTIQFYDYQKNIDYHVDFPLILRYIQTNYNHLTLHSLADFFHFSDSYMSRLIRNNTGCTFIDLLTMLRLTKAHELLLQTDLYIGQIASQVGYDNTDHFSRSFKKKYGVSPREYRTQNSK